METLLSALALIISTLQGISSAVLAKSPTDTRRVGKELANLVIEVDNILNRANEIILLIEQLASHELSAVDFEKLELQLKQQAKDIEKLARTTKSLGLDSGTSPQWHSGTERVIHVFGERPFALTTLLDYKGYMVEELRAFIENSVIFSQDGKFTARSYRFQSKPIRSSDEYPEPPIDRKSIEDSVRDGWLIYTEIDLRLPKQRRKYFSELRKQLSEIKSERKAIIKVLRSQFEVKDIV